VKGRPVQVPRISRRASPPLLQLASNLIFFPEKATATRGMLAPAAVEWMRASPGTRTLAACHAPPPSRAPPAASPTRLPALPPRRTPFTPAGTPGPAGRERRGVAGGLGVGWGSVQGRGCCFARPWGGRGGSGSRQLPGGGEAARSQVQRGPARLPRLGERQESAPGPAPGVAPLPRFLLQKRRVGPSHLSEQRLLQPRGSRPSPCPAPPAPPRAGVSAARL